MKSPRLSPRMAAGILLSLLVSVALSACGGGTMTAGGGVGGTGISVGSVTDFGSVFVNGVEFITDNNTRRRLLDISTENQSGTDNVVFRRGMVVRVRHTGDNNAVQIDFQDDLEGPVANFDNTAGTFSVLGQPVAFDNATNIFLEPGAAFANDNIVEVSGLYDADGNLRATFIKIEAPPAKTVFEIKGFVNNLNTLQQTFTIGPRPGTGTIVVNYASVPPDQFKDLPTGLANGLFVEVKTTSAAGPPIVATSVEGKTSVADEAATSTSVSLEGFVANLSAPSPPFTFVIDGLTVSASAATPGVSNVEPNAHVQVEGIVTNGVLAAGKISLR